MAVSVQSGAQRAGFLALIPVRGSSKSLPGKNFRTVGGLPLISRTIRTALRVPGVRRVLVSTDADELAALARREGAEVPFLRPAELAADTTPLMDVLRHSWEHVQDREGLEGVILLQATSPFLRAETVRRALEEFRQSRAPVLRAVRKVREHPAWMLRAAGDRVISYSEAPARTGEEKEPLYIPCGAVSVCGPEYLQAPDAGAPAAWIEVSWPESIDIDEPQDLIVAQCLAEKGHW
jgi:N-acylneuraminate cytidylyltransferase